MPRKPAQPPDLLKEIEENYRWSQEFWAPIHSEGNKDVGYIAGDPWDPRDVNARETNEQKRPHLVFDEGSQYINMFCGQAMQQKRQVKVDPVNERVDAETAEKMQGRIMHIDYVGRGQAHSIKALRDAATRGYGWMSMRKKYSAPTGREQEPCWNPVANPDSRLPDPNSKEPDFSDMEFCFVRDIVKKSYIQKRWPWAANLGGDDVRTVTLTEYWRVTKEPVDCTYWLNDGSENGIEVKESTLPQGSSIGKNSITVGGRSYDILDEREEEEKRVCKYICQLVEPGAKGHESAPDLATVEILEEEPWDGQFIPEVPILGPEYYVTTGGTTTKIYLSLLRRARDPMGLLNLTRTNQAELVAMTPKTRAMGYEGQFEGHEDEWANIGTSPLAYLQVKPVVDPMTNSVLPLPELMRWEPPIQALELLAQGCMNAIRSAIGQLASPELDKTKSGIALEKIRQGGESAVYHLLDAYDVALTQIGRIEGDLMERTHDTPRTIAIRKPDGEQELTHFNKAYEDKGKRKFHKIEPGAFAYTISTGPSYQSQFDENKEFIANLISKMPVLMLDGSGHTILGDLLVKIMNMGPEGEEIVSRFQKLLRPELQDSNVDIPPVVQAEFAKAQKVIDFLTEKVNALQDVIENKSLELQSEERRADQDNKTKIAIAEINAQVKENMLQLQVSMDHIANSMNQQFEAMKGNQQHAQAMEQQDAQQQHETQMAEKGHAQTMEQQQQAADLAPEPATSS